MLVLGLIGVPVGMALVVVALYNPSLTLYLLGSAIAGAGAGLLFKAALSVAITTAEPGSTAGVLALFFVVAYLGVGLPGSVDRGHAPDQQPVSVDRLQCGHPGGLRHRRAAPSGSAAPLIAKSISVVE